MLMDQGTELWLFKTARKHYWRVSRWMDLDDLIQEGYECYWYAVRKYPDVVDRPHMTSLFKLTFHSRITDLANRKRKCCDVLISSDPSDPVSVFWEHLIDEADYTSVKTALAKAPLPVIKVLELLASEEGRKKLRSVYRRRPGGTRETFNERLARLTGLEPGTDFTQEFRSYFNT